MEELNNEIETKTKTKKEKKKNCTQAYYCNRMVFQMQIITILCFLQPISATILNRIKVNSYKSKM